MEHFLVFGLHPALHKVCVALKIPVLENHVPE